MNYFIGNLSVVFWSGAFVYSKEQWTGRKQH
jgi:hypothetical protein